MERIDNAYIALTSMGGTHHKAQCLCVQLSISPVLTVNTTLKHPLTTTILGHIFSESPYKYVAVDPVATYVAVTRDEVLF